MSESTPKIGSEAEGSAVGESQSSDGGALKKRSSNKAANGKQPPSDTEGGVTTDDELDDIYETGGLDVDPKTGKSSRAKGSNVGGKEGEKTSTEIPPTELAGAPTDDAAKGKEPEQSGNETDTSLTAGLPTEGDNASTISNFELEDISVEQAGTGSIKPSIENDFGQAQLLEAAKQEAELRKGMDWGSEEEEEEEEEEGGLADLVGRSAAKKSEVNLREGEEATRKRRRKRKDPEDSKTEKKGKEKAEKKAKEEKVWVEPTYEESEFISGPIVTTDCDIKPNTAFVFQSYGYDCLRSYNVHSLDEDTIAYITGNYVHFYSVSRNQVTGLRRSASGYGIGHIAVHPERKHFAVAEKGDWPMIVIYTWPDQKVHRVLRNGTSLGYSYVNFSADGKLVCSQGMDPDYLLTIWNWAIERIVLHVKAFSQDIYRATFSTTHPGQLTTCGIGHIRFWKMAQTFTGLKLQGLIGRFGKTEISDITGFAGLQDGKVVSGSEWGNLLVWDGGLIVVEIIQKTGKNCHDGEITDIVYLETGEILTVGLDGYLKLWDSEIIDTADTIVDDSGKFGVEPIFELRLSSLAKPVSVTRRQGDDESAWLIQDGWGKVWTTSITQAMKDPDYIPSSIFSCPGGPINTIATSPVYTIMAVGTSTGHLWLIEYITKQNIAKVKYTNNVSITKLIWLGTHFDHTATSFLAAFSDGNVRLLAVEKIKPIVPDGGVLPASATPTGAAGSPDASAMSSAVSQRTSLDLGDAELPFSIQLLQILRFHKVKINVMKLDEETATLYTCGEDKVIFASKIKVDEESLRPYIKPLSFVTAPFSVISLDLHPIKDYRLVIASRTGRIAECRRPLWAELGTATSYNGGKLHGRSWAYTSVKSARRKAERKIARKLELEEKIVELKADLAERRTRGLFVEEEVELSRLADVYKRMQMKDEETELYIPEKPCPVLAVYYRINQNWRDNLASRNFFVHVSGYDSGYIYECKCSRPEPGGFHVIPPTPPFQTDVAITAYIISPDDEYLIFGMEDGTLRMMSRYQPGKLASKSKESNDKLKTSTDKEPNDPSKAKTKTPRQSTAARTASHQLTISNTLENADADDSVETINVMANEKSRKKRALPPFPVTQFPYNLDDFVCLPMHDPNRGKVNELAWGSDGRFLFSVANDGSIFSYIWDPQKGPQDDNPSVSVSERLLPTEEAPIENVILDTQDQNSLSLEETKLKAEADRLWELAEGKKEVLRKKIRELKSKFRFLHQKNNEIPEESRLPRSNFEIDPSIRQPKKLRLMKGIEEIYRRFEWTSAKSILHVEKIQKHFFSEIKTFHMVIKDISHKSQTHTFRYRILTPEFETLNNSNKLELIQEEIQHQAELEQSHVVPVVKPMHVTRVWARELIGDYEGKKYDTRTLHQIRTLEDRLQKRYEKELCWSELNARKIPDDYEDPQDVLEIAKAKQNLGDYKLKSSETYTGEKISVAMRRHRVIEMKLRIHDCLKTFNQYVLDLRSEKRSILNECRRLEKELLKIQRQLPKDLHKPIPEIYDLESCEEPEKEFDITDQMVRSRVAKKINTLGLTARKERQLEILEKENTLGRQVFAESQKERMENCGQAAIKAQETKTGKVAPKQVQQQGAGTKTTGPGALNPVTSRQKVNIDKEAQSTVKQRKAFFKPKTLMGNTRLELALQFRCFQQDTILRKLNQLIDYFHDRVEKVRDERVALQVDILLMSMKMLCLIQELDVVMEFDSTERAVLERFEAQKVETIEAKNRMDRVERRLQRLTADFQKIEAGIVDVQKEVNQVIGDKHKYADFLWKVYKKKIRVDNENEDESESYIERNQDSSSSSGDSNDSTSQDSGSDLFKLPKQKLNPNVCPDQLDKQLYEKVCELRSKRTQLEIECESQKKVVQKIQRDFEDVKRVHNKYKGRLQGIEEEVYALQKKKQAKMNVLDFLVVLKADQIQCLDEDEFDEFHGSIVERMKHHFPDVNDIVLFPKDGIGRLDLRIEELKEETNAEREKHKRARNMMVRLAEELTKLEKEVAVISLRCKQEMINKFGKVVDLDDVCAAVINLEILDELLRLENRRNWHYRERKKIADEIEKARDRLTVLTKENSESNTLLAILVERQRDVEYFLYQQHKKEQEQMVLEEELANKDSDTILSGNNQFDMDAELISNEDALEELFNLEDILTRQETRIMILREAIAACKFKSGLPPLIPLRSIKDDVASCFMTVNELLALRERRNLEVDTVYVGDDIANIGDSNSRFPSFVSPMESMTYQSGPRDTSLREVEDLNSGAAGGKISNAAGRASPAGSLVDEEGLEEDMDMTQDEDDEGAEADETFDTEYRPPGYDAEGTAGAQDGDQSGSPEGQQKRLSYPLNIIPDDQMALPADDDEAAKDIEEEYEEDPIPVAKPSESPTK